MPTIPHRAPPRLFSLADAVERNRRVVLGLRVSGHSQIGRGSLDRQRQAARSAIREAGGKLVGISGNDSPQPGRLSSGRWSDVEHDIELAHRLRAILCYYNIARMIRAEQSHGRLAPFVLPTPQEVEQVLRMAADHGVTVATIEPPDLDGREIRSRDTRRGMQHGNRGGRPKIMDQIPPRIVQLVLDLHSRGRSIRDISGMEALGLSKSAVASILSGAKGGGSP